MNVWGEKRLPSGLLLLLLFFLTFSRGEFTCVLPDSGDSGLPPCAHSANLLLQTSITCFSSIYLCCWVMTDNSTQYENCITAAPSLITAEREHLNSENTPRSQRLVTNVLNYFLSSSSHDNANDRNKSPNSYSQCNDSDCQVMEGRLQVTHDPSPVYDNFDDSDVYSYLNNSDTYSYDDYYYYYDDDNYYYNDNYEDTDPPVEPIEPIDSDELGDFDQPVEPIDSDELGDFDQPVESNEPEESDGLSDFDNYNNCDDEDNNIDDCDTSASDDSTVAVPDLGPFPGPADAGVPATYSCDAAGILENSELDMFTCKELCEEAERNGFHPLEYRRFTSGCQFWNWKYTNEKVGASPSGHRCFMNWQIGQLHTSLADELLWRPPVVAYGSTSEPAECQRLCQSYRDANGAAGCAYWSWVVFKPTRAEYMPHPKETCLLFPQEQWDIVMTQDISKVTVPNPVCTLDLYYACLIWGQGLKCPDTKGQLCIKPNYRIFTGLQQPCANLDLCSGEVSPWPTDAPTEPPGSTLPPRQRPLDAMISL